MSRFLALILGLGLLGTAAAQAAGADDVAPALSAAEAANREAGALKDQWTVTAEALKQAREAAAAGRHDEALRLARRAEALARLSIAQAKEQQQAWKDAVIHR